MLLSEMFPVSFSIFTLPFIFPSCAVFIFPLIDFPSHKFASIGYAAAFILTFFEKKQAQNMNIGKHQNQIGVQ
jgi:hypothetical protein